MLTITLPDGAKREYPQALTAGEVAKSISSGLLKAAIAARVNGTLVDLSFLIENNSEFSVVTEKDPEALEIVRHSTAHLLAQAVQRLYPGTQVTIGPVIEDGFYYDFASEHRFTPEDLIKIEKEMQRIVKRNAVVSRVVMTRAEALKTFADMGEDYKVQIIEDIPEEQTLTAYKQDEFIDLCRGPHVPSTKWLKAFKLTKIAGAYWRGDSNNEMLQRIYGTAWLNKEDLDLYIKRLAEAEQRDHRLLAKKMDLFHIQEEAPGSVFWHPNGWTLYNAVKKYVRESQDRYGYAEINTPILVDFKLWEKSGHADKFSDDMFTLEAEHRRYAIKPMNCPCHVQVFNQGLKSYRDLPIRYSEFGCCHRNEPSGTLHGLMRVRAFTQDDGHIFCAPESIDQESGHFIDQLKEMYTDFGFDSFQVKLSTRPAKRVGSDELWDEAEKKMQQVLEDKGIDWELSPGEGAFYGPKYEFTLKDCLGRVWQCGTLQLDFFVPERLGATYVAEDGAKRTPVMLHRAVLGSFERFIGILLEHYAGDMPLWLAPKQVVVLPIADRHHEYAQQVANKLKNLGIRAEYDLRNEKIGFKIREHSISRVPYLVVIGDQELDQNTITIRMRTEGNASEQKSGLNVDDFISQLQQQIRDKK